MAYAHSSIGLTTDLGISFIPFFQQAEFLNGEVLPFAMMKRQNAHKDTDNFLVIVDVP
jgi:hypothetical protein